VQRNFPFWYYSVVSSRSEVVPTPDLVPLSYEKMEGTLSASQVIPPGSPDSRYWLFIDCMLS
jgi:hypothetical protein